MRTALGAAGGGSQDPKALLDAYLQTVAGPGGKTAVTWPAGEVMAAGQAAVGSVWTQTLLNLCLLALETQPACKTLNIDVSTGGETTITIESRGAPDRTAALRAELIAAVAGEAAPALSAKTIHGNLTGRLVRNAGGRLALMAEGNAVIVTATFPKAAA